MTKQAEKQAIARQNRETVAKLMKDGRPRTATDVANRTGIKPQSAGLALAALRKSGLVKSETVHTDGGAITIWEKVKP